MVDVLIELDDAVIKQFELKAELKGRSLEDELRAAIVTAAESTVAEPPLARQGTRHDG